MTSTRSLREALRELGDADTSLVHPTYRHLQRRTRLFGLTFVQWGQIAACLLVAWLLSRLLPLPAPYDVSVAVTLAGVPAAAAVVAADGELDAAAFVRGLRSWNTARGIYLPGKPIDASCVRGYELHAERSATHDARAVAPTLPSFDGWSA